MNQMANNQTYTTLEELEKFALPDDNAKFITTLKTHSCFQTFAASGTIGNLQFFNNQTITTLNTTSYPNNQVMTEVLGIKIVHNLQLLSTNIDVTNKANQWFEQTVRFKYTTPGRDSRVNKPLYELTGNNGYIGSDGTMANTLLSNNFNNDGFWKLPQIRRGDKTFSELIIGAKQTPSFTIDVGGGTWTLAATDATGSNGTPTAPTISGLTLTGGFFIALHLQVREWSPINM
jgi:hypothetical protein